MYGKKEHKKAVPAQFLPIKTPLCRLLMLHKGVFVSHSMLLGQLGSRTDSVPTIPGGQNVSAAHPAGRALSSKTLDRL